MSDTVSTTVRDLLQSVVNAPTWEETRQIIDQNQALLLTEEADTEFASWIARGFEDNEIFTVQDINWYRSLLQHCRFQSIDATLDRLP